MSHRRIDRALPWIAGGLLLAAGCHRHKAAPPPKPVELGTLPGTHATGATPPAPSLGPIAAGELVKTLDTVLDRLEKAGHDPALLPAAVAQSRADLGSMERAAGAYRLQHKDAAAEKFSSEVDAARGRLARAVGEAATAAHIVSFGGSWAPLDQAVALAREEVKNADALLPSAP